MKSPSLAPRPDCNEGREQSARRRASGVRLRRVGNIELKAALHAPMRKHMLALLRSGYCICGMRFIVREVWRSSSRALALSALIAWVTAGRWPLACLPGDHDHVPLQRLDLGDEQNQ